MRRLLQFFDRRAAAPTVLLALTCYLPLLLTRPGQVGADTKSYLYLDPGRLISDAPWMWDRATGMGTVTHQNIGYLFPMGPYYWLADAIGLPDWVAQRIWLASIMFLAGLGVRFLLKTLKWVGPGVTVAAFAYALSPYVIHYGARISVILLPFAALPWLIALSARALRNGGWRDPARFALVVLLVGGVNATSLVLVGLGPLLWFVHATWVANEVGLTTALRTAGRIGVLTFATSTWWIAGLVIQGRYGIPILRYTETYEVVADAALASELLRGLGYWFFYGNDKLGPWIQAATTYTRSTPTMVVSFAVPLVAFLAALLTRWRHRVYFVLLIAVGVVASVGAHPFDSPSPLGSLFKAWTTTDSGLAFRSTPRAVPLIVLGTAVMLAAAVAAVGEWRPSLRPVVAAGLLLLVVANMAPLWQGDLVDPNLVRPESVPTYWQEAAAALDEGDASGRVLELPGIDFASYRWGNTVDPITPGLTNRDYVGRELIPYGSPASADLLNAVDLRFQSGQYDPDSLAALARLMGVSEIVLRSDLQYERYRTPRPRPTFRSLADTPGLGAPETFGEPVANTPVPELPLVDEVELGTPNSWEDPPPVAIFPVEDPLPGLRAVSAQSPVVLSGDGEGVVSLAEAGLLDPARLLVYSATFAGEPAALDDLVGDDAELVVTDTNRRRARRWGSVRENDGYTERADEVPLVDDPKDNRLELFPDADTDASSVMVNRGNATAQATDYGNPVTYSPGERAALAIDGDPTTSWRVGAFADVRGEQLLITADDAVRPGAIHLLQPQEAANRRITRVRLTFDGVETVDVDLTESSLVGTGQRVDVGNRRFTSLSIEVLATDRGVLKTYEGVSGVGFAEVRVGNLRQADVLRLPVDLLDHLGERSDDHVLRYILDRRHADSAEPVVEDEERYMARLLDLPSTREFTVAGAAQLSDHLADEAVDAILGIPSAAAGGITARSSERLPGSLTSRAAMAIDANPETAWQSRLGVGPGAWLELQFGVPVAFDGIDIDVVADGRHSLPSRVTVVADGVPVTTVDIAAIEGSSERGHVERVTLPTPVMLANTVQLVFDEVQAVDTIDWYGGETVALPLGIAEVGLDLAPTLAPAPEQLPPVCRTDLLALDGDPVGLLVTGTTADAAAGNELDLSACDPTGATTAPPLRLHRGELELRTTDGAVSGVDVEQLALSSAPGGQALPPSDATAEGDPDGAGGPHLTLGNQGRAAYQAAVDADEPFWLVLGQSINDGWVATADGRDLGAPTLVNGFANGWLVDPGSEGSVAITARWAPQRIVWLGLATSAVGAVVCVALARPGVRRRRRHSPVVSPDRIRPVLPAAISPLDHYGKPIRGVRAATLALALTAAAAVSVHPLWALPIGALAGAALATDWGWPLVRLACAGCLAAAGAWVCLEQVLNDYPSEFDWPQHFLPTHLLAMGAVALLVVDALVESQRGSWRREVDV